MEIGIFRSAKKMVGAALPRGECPLGHLSDRPAHEQLERLARLLLRMTHLAEGDLDWGRAFPDPAGIWGDSPGGTPGQVGVGSQWEWRGTRPWCLQSASISGHGRFFLLLGFLMLSRRQCISSLLAG